MGTMKSVVLFLLCIKFSLLGADISISNYLNAYKSTELLYSGEGYFFEIPDNCTRILKSFAECAMNFTRCSIEHARPVKLCKECVNDYVQFFNTYQQLLHTEVNGTTCKSMYLSHDRFEVVLSYYNSIDAIWDKGNCNGCFDWSTENPQISNSTKKFNTMFNETMDCIKSNYYPTMNDTEEVCQKCSQSYIQLDEYYKSLSSDAIGVDSICMDIVDSMNTTRSIWSKTLNCCKLRRHPEIIFLCVTGVISFLPLLFYVVVRFCGPIRDLPNVLKQSRFNQTILRSADGRIN